MNRLQLKKRIFSENELPKNFLRFYAVGLLLFVIPFTRPLFFHITALSLLIVFIVTFYFHPKWTFSNILWFAFIAISSFLLEMAGVTTGELFGVYQYDSSLGPKINGTPLIIGINWVFLVYASHGIIYQITRHKLLKIAGGALLMVGYDCIMELAAPPMKMWHFDSFYPPLENFVVWFLAAICYHIGIVVFKIPVYNKVASALFWSQLLFFTGISVYRLFFIR